MVVWWVFEAGGEGDGEQQGEGEGVMAHSESSWEFGEQELFCVGLSVTLVVDCAFLVVFWPVYVFESIDSDVELLVGPVCEAVDVDEPLDGLAGCGDSLVEGHVDDALLVFV